MDVDVFKQRFLPFHPKLYRIAYALLDNKADAEDILQDAYCKLWNKRDELGDIQNPEAFSITLVKNLCLDFLRSPKASRRDNEEALETVLLTTDSSPEKELEEKHGIKILSFSFYDGPRHFMTNKPINTPDDLKGQRIRTIGQEVCTESLAAMGATPISMSWGEVYNGIQSKALDGCEAQNTSTFPSKIYEVCNTQSKTGHFQLMQGLICGKKWFDSLPEDLQTLLTETAQEIGKETAADVMKEADEAEQQMKDAGLTVIEPDVQPFKDAVEPVYEKLGFSELRQQIYKEIGKTE